ncbi:hypothetical protein PYW07_006333 [Mythimna separata]|uniref:Hemicentin-1 n=1 Tax=Mythimna separata TaxID=271217 RepID=A0AAD7YTE9_MYTSE|nr:hypothetical protein PYW07_006333 [Mythimna separata]
MTSYGQYFVLLLILQTCAIYGEEVIKSSLTFVIDDTGSMAGEIRQVKEEVNIIFEKVMSSKSSQIENFVLVTFNDPTAQLRTITTDRDEFKRQVAAISVHGGGDCPEYAMTGIELGLKESLPLSYLYVFTDASAKDYDRFDQIKSISQKKQSQVVFILTGQCGSKSSADYQVYHQVARATNGQVFHMMKDDVKDILKYVEEAITSRAIPLVNTILKPGYGKTITYPVDSHTGPVMISVTGDGATIGEVTGPGGSKPTKEPVVSKPGIAIVKVTNATVGDHEVEVGSTSDTHVMVTAKSDLNFQLGFAVYKPNSMKDTVTRPAPVGDAFLGVRLLGSGVRLTTAKILDMSDNVIAEVPLELIDEATQFYASPSFSPPSTMFRVSVSGIDVATKSPITRKGPSPIERQPLTDEKENRSPVITIDGAPKIITEYDGPLQLKCNVQGYPQPDITWQEKDSVNTIPAEVKMIEFPYKYVSILDINKANKNVTYQCKASNIIGVEIKYVEVETKRKIYFTVTDTPKDSVVEYNKEGRLVCKVDSYPPASITWYKDGAEVSEDSNIDFSSDKSTLTIKYMQVDLQGKYTCEARNDFDRKVFIAKVAIFGVEKPVIDNTHKVVRAVEKTNAELSCRMLKGIPTPRISWSFQPAGEATFRPMAETSATVHLNNVGRDRSGLYKCSALNALGSDSFDIQLVVEYPPEIKKDIDYIRKKDGEEVRISCDVTGEPFPAVKWLLNDTKIETSAKMRIASDHSLSFKVTPAHMGYYTCEAENKLNKVKRTVFLNVLEKPAIDKRNREIFVIQKTNIDLVCRIVQGNPEPDIRWYYRAPGSGSFRAISETSKTLRLNNVDKKHTGSYKCTATNSVGDDEFQMELVVEYPPEIKKDIDYIRKKDGEEVRISCDVTGEPFPAVKWLLNDTKIETSAKMRIASDHSLSFKVTPAHMGYFTCEAENKLNKVKRTVFLNVLEKPAIDKRNTEIFVIQKTNIDLVCRIVQGNPVPDIRWYYRAPGSGSFRAISETSKTLRLNNVNKKHTGSYKCTATNSVGDDEFQMELVVEYPPIIKADVDVILSKDDDEVRISCDATGEPTPAVRWFFNNTIFDSAAKKRISLDQSLRFKARLTDIGYYRCEAVNKLGGAKKTTFLNVYIPVTIETPKKSKIEVMVGKSHMLNCRADGYPKPNIKWTFQSLDPMKPAIDVTPTAGVAALQLKNMQLEQQGSYTCEAENGIGAPAHITYEVNIYAPPVIYNVYPKKAFEALAGDPTLKIQCKATGSPKPSIVWIKNGLNLAIGTDWYDMEEDGTLVIKNIERESAGIYVCRAQNVFGEDTEAYEVIVQDSLVPDTPTNTVSVPEGETVDINCDIPHASTDKIRWYKSGVVIAVGKLTLYSVTRTDDGLYTCRVIDGARPRSATTKVVIGFKPRFTSVEEETVDFVHGADLKFLSCEAYGEPRPTSAIWKHDGETLSTTTMSYPLAMEYGATGTYECEVSNEFGSIRRTFTVSSRDCILDIKKDFPERQPIMFSPSLGWPVFDVTDGYMSIRHQGYFYVNCPSTFSNPNLPTASNLMVFCERDNIVKIYGKTYKFSDIQCKEEVKAQVSRTGIPCLKGDTETVKIGYKVFTEFIGVYEVCLDKRNNVPLFAKHKLSPDHTDSSNEAGWASSVLPHDFDVLYDCGNQAYDISSALGRGLSSGDSCCFGKRQLVNSRDLLPGVPTTAAYDYLNVIPHWSTCSTKNWEDVEQSVRDLVKAAGRDLMITTGTANPRHASSPAITLQDGSGSTQTAAPYLWKVVQDPAQQASLAIIQVNIPDLTDTEAESHVLCADICSSSISWLTPDNFHSADDGYIFCCAISDFERAFGYIGRFSPLMNYVLFDGNRMPEFYTKKK